MIGFIRHSPAARAQACAAIAAVLIAAPAFAQTGSPDDIAIDTPTFTRDVLPILQEHCQMCHRPGQIAPMSLLTYEEVRPWAKSIRNEVAARNMPPFHAAGPIGRFQQDLRLNDDDIARIERWVDRGAPRGDENDAPAPITWPAEDWQLDRRNLTIAFDEYQFNNNGDDYWAVFYDDYVFPENTWIDGIEYLPSDFKHVHHAGLFAVKRDLHASGKPFVETSDAITDELLAGQHLMTWLPGRGPFTYPEGQGFEIEKGCRIALQIHLAPTEVPINLHSQIGIRFVNGVLRYETKTHVMMFLDVEIPPGDPHCEFRANQTFLREMTVQSFLVHMHVRGKASSVIFRYPDGRAETVFEIPRYNFDWQREYYLAEPITVPQGTEIEFTSVWDNSKDNPLNPDPSQTVRWGRKTSDEMNSTSIQSRLKRPQPLLVKNGVVVGTLEAGD